MSEDNAYFLDRLVKAAKGQIYAKYAKYTSVIIIVLAGDKEEVIEAETLLNSDDFPCRNAIIKLSGWKGKKEEKE